MNGGLDEAKLVADQGGFYLLGEVLPQSNLYHFKQKSLNKRSTDQTVKELSEIKNVKSFSHQTVQKVNDISLWKIERYKFSYN